MSLCSVPLKLDLKCFPPLLYFFPRLLTADPIRTQRVGLLLKAVSSLTRASWIRHLLDGFIGVSLT